MAQRSKSTYRIVLRGPKGFAQLRYAKTFEIWYGKRRISGPNAFPRNKKKAAERRSYLERRVRSIERIRLEIVAAAVEKRKRTLAFKKKSQTAKDIARQKRVKQRETRQIRSAPKKPSQIDMALWKDHSTYALGDLPIFPKIRAEESEEYLNVVQIDKVVTPIEPDNGTYSKQLVDKMMWTSVSGYYNLSILDFSLNPDEYVSMNTDLFMEAYTHVYTLFFPHVLSFYDTTKHSTDAYIFRVKFAWSPGEAKSDLESYGISLHRKAYENRDQVLNSFRETFLKMFGTKDPYDRTKLLTTNYMYGDSMVYIKGFTLESVKFDKL